MIVFGCAWLFCLLGWLCACVVLVGCFCLLVCFGWVACGLLIVLATILCCVDYLWWFDYVVIALSWIDSLDSLLDC